MAAKVVLLGTGNPNPDPQRSGPSVAVVVEDMAYIVDAGPGVVRQAQAGYLKGIEALKADRLEMLFLTHLHSDHTAGLPDIMFTPWVMERKEPLKIFGPPGTGDMVKHMTYAFEKDINIRKKGLERANDTGWRSVVKEIAEGRVFSDERVDVEAFRVKHGAWDRAFGYRFITDDGCVVVSGDCSPTPGLEDNYKGADVLVHEVYSKAGFDGRPEGWKAYHSSAHTSSVQLASIAKAAGPKLLVLYHQLLWGRPEEELVREISTIYDGTVVSGKDLDIFKV
ncbi:MAG: MBL fold metallo-hydrolase [Thermoplasmatota archaeon]